MPSARERIIHPSIHDPSPHLEGECLLVGAKPTKATHCLTVHPKHPCTYGPFPSPPNFPRHSSLLYAYIYAISASCPPHLLSHRSINYHCPRNHGVRTTRRRWQKPAAAANPAVQVLQPGGAEIDTGPRGQRAGSSGAASRGRRMGQLSQGESRCRRCTLPNAAGRSRRRPSRRSPRAIRPLPEADIEHSGRRRRRRPGPCRSNSEGQAHHHTLANQRRLLQ